jgi:general transcription factor 3C polypeptide 3 (transcription factor C subunit 4)
MQRKTRNRNVDVMRGLAFLQRYQDHRLNNGRDGTGRSPVWMEQEAYYNIGRAFHMLGLMHHAVCMYQQALALSDAIRVEDRQFYDLRFDIAYNLSTLYQQQGNWQMAQHLLEQHVFC